MPARGGSAVIVNHRVALSGTKARAAVVSHRVEYVATRPGCDRSATEADLARAREREAFVGYLGCRPGSTALFDADGAVSLAEARRRLDACGGAVVCSVISVRREDCERFGLDTKEGWQAYARANLTREYARMMGIPESRVGWVAAHHLNSEANQHIHVLAFDKAGRFDRLMAKPDLERARRDLTEAAVAPEVARLGLERETARERVVEILRSMDGASLSRGVELPPEGRVSYAHLRRWHPEATRQMESAVGRAAEERPELRAALDAHASACVGLADLRGLGGAERGAYLAKADADVRARACNAALRAMSPERRTSPRPAPEDGPAATRRRERAVGRELAACMGKRQTAEAVAAAHEGHPVPKSAVRGCPSFEALGRHSPAPLESALSGASRAFASAMPDGRRDPDEEARTMLRALSRVAVRALLRAPGALGTAARVAVAVSQPIRTIMSISM
jgi:hypothetical protein